MASRCPSVRKQASGQKCAAGTARSRQSTTRPNGCQTYGSIGVPVQQMLRFLRIEHLAVIDAVQVEFEPGLNVLTGETGAGKSMLVEAVGLLMGGRASADLIRTGESQASVQASRSTKAGPTASRTDRPPRHQRAGPQPRVRQRHARHGRGARAMQTSPLVELHGQHEHQTLLDPQSHLLMLDEFAGLCRSRERGRPRHFANGSSCSPSSTRFRWTSARKPRGSIC